MSRAGRTPPSPATGSSILRQHSLKILSLPPEIFVIVSISFIIINFCFFFVLSFFKIRWFRSPIKFTSWNEFVLLLSRAVTDKIQRAHTVAIQPHLPHSETHRLRQQFPRFLFQCERVISLLPSVVSASASSLQQSSLIRISFRMLAERLDSVGFLSMRSEENGRPSPINMAARKKSQGEATKTNYPSSIYAQSVDSINQYDFRVQCIVFNKVPFLKIQS